MWPITKLDCLIFVHTFGFNLSIYFSPPHHAKCQANCEEWKTLFLRSVQQRDECRENPMHEDSLPDPCRPIMRPALFYYPTKFCQILSNVMRNAEDLWNTVIYCMTLCQPNQEEDAQPVAYEIIICSFLSWWTVTAQSHLNDVIDVVMVGYCLGCDSHSDITMNWRTLVRNS